MTKKVAPVATTTAKPGVTAQGYRGEHEKDMVNRLRRVEGQVRGLVDMIQSGRSCEDVATQMSATRKAMDKAFYRMMTCSLIEAVHESKSDEEAIIEVERSARLLEKFA
jgi:CsoR family transcriptional regulator, copper-sensing transcriptional repressor